MEVTGIIYQTIFANLKGLENVGFITLALFLI